MTLYGVRLLNETIKITISGSEHTPKLQWAEGMAGVLPVFDSYNKALEYAENKELIFKLKGNT